MPTITDNKAPPRGPEDKVHQAILMTMSAVSKNEPRNFHEWNSQMRTMLMEIRQHYDNFKDFKKWDSEHKVPEYIRREVKRVKKKDEEGLEDKDLFKDAPPLSNRKKRVTNVNTDLFKPKEDFAFVPVRYKGPIDRGHTAENEIGTRMHAMLDAIEAKYLGRKSRKMIVSSIAYLAEALDAEGVVLDQGKEFANPSTLPKPTEHTFDPRLFVSYAHKGKPFITRLNKLLEKDAGLSI